MTIQTANPLAKHFRQPQLYLKLPSQGRWWEKGSIEMPPTGELAVYSMTARDELAFKTPDALLNGQATVEVIQSCIPAIKNAWKMPIVDLDAILISIRQATYGNEMNFVSICPHCNNKNEHVADLGYIMTLCNCPEYQKTLEVDDLEIYLQPENYEEFNKASMRNFEEQRLIQLVSTEDISEDERIIKFNNMFSKLLKMTVKQVAGSVGAIKMKDGTVIDNKDYILEYFENCERTVWNAVKDRLDDLGQQSKLKNLNVNCDNPDCGKNYETPLIFELSSFFV